MAADYDASDRAKSMAYIQQHQALGEVVTGLLYVDSDPRDMHDHLNTVQTPFNCLSEVELCPGSGALDKINASLR